MNLSLYPSLPVLLVDDEEQLLQSYEITLRFHGINNIIRCHDSREVIPILSRQDIGVMVLDLFMPNLSGDEVLSRVVYDFPVIPVIIITGGTDLDKTVNCLKIGAFDYLLKPVEGIRLITTVKHAIRLRELGRDNKAFKKYLLSNNLEYPDAFSDILTKSSVMKAIFQFVEAISPNFGPVLITGERGVGKEQIARAINKLVSPGGPFIKLNASDMSDDVFSDTLLGHRKGAFPGANESQRGMIEKASGGSLFFENIEDLSSESQIVLLQLIRHREYSPIGSKTPKYINSKFILTCSKDISSILNSGRLRNDLYHELLPYHIHIPPLRERMDDLPLLAKHFLEKATLQNNKELKFSDEVIPFLSKYDFPGNIRELESLIFDVVINNKSAELSIDNIKSVMNKICW